MKLIFLTTHEYNNDLLNAETLRNARRNGQKQNNNIGLYCITPRPKKSNGQKTSKNIKYFLHCE